MFTTVASSTTMSWATATMTRISQRLSRAGAADVTSGVDMRSGSFRGLCSAGRAGRRGGWGAGGAAAGARRAGRGGRGGGGGGAGRGQEAGGGGREGAGAAAGRPPAAGRGVEVAAGRAGAAAALARVVQRKPPAE